jgi:hypothetical protein
MGFSEYDRIVLELFFREEQFNKLEVGFFLFENPIFPEFFFLG